MREQPSSVSPAMEQWPTFQRRWRRDVSPTRSLALIDLSGKVTPLDLPAGPYHSPRFSLPDGKQIALYTSDGVIWIHDLSGTKPIRQTHPRGAEILLPCGHGMDASCFASMVEGQRRTVLAARRWQRSGRTTDGTRCAPHTFRILFPQTGRPFSCGGRARKSRTSNRHIVPEWR